MAARAAMWNASVFRKEGLLDWEEVKIDFLRKVRMGWSAQ